MVFVNNVKVYEEDDIDNDDYDYEYDVFDYGNQDRNGLYFNIVDNIDNIFENIFVCYCIYIVFEFFKKNQKFDV